jgi:hypothetical protein
LRNAPVAAFVCLDFIAPELYIGAGQVLAAAAVPETAIHKHRYLPAGPCEVGFADHRPVFAVSPYPGSPKKLRQRQLGRCVAARTHSGHDFGTDFLRDVIHDTPLLF